MRQILARYISGIFNPFLLGFAIITLFSFRGTGSIPEALKWMGISIILSVIPVLALVVFLVRRHKLDSIFMNPRRQRYRIYAVSSFLGALGVVIMWLSDAPLLLKNTFLAGFIAIVVFMTINFVWKISLHTAFVSASATILTMVYGWEGAFSILALPAVAWSRIELKQHSIAQVTVGAACAAGITLGVFLTCGCL